VCPNCRTENPPGMKFCRHCGTVLQAAPTASPPHPMGYGAPPPYAQPPLPVAPTMVPPSPMGGPMGGPPGTGIVAGSIGGPASAPSGMPATCPRCGAPTQPGFAFCQQCGTKLGGPSPLGPGVDALAGTIASQGPVAAQARAGAMPAPASLGLPASGGAARNPFGGPAAQQVAAGLAPTPAAGGWGSAVSVNRDGTDGDRYPLAGEFVVIGRMASSGADIVFDQDRFLARQHARLEATPDGSARIVPLDTLNGVYRKIDAPVPLTDGTVILAGREVLRYEVLDGDEKAGTPLVRHGVALFGSPPREPWGRLLQLLPSGGIRDVRHLWDDEIVIGREDGDLVYSDDQFLSRRHASIGWDGTRATLTDLGSSNGTFVRLAGPTAVKHGDHLRMGDQLFRIELRR